MKNSIKSLIGVFLLLSIYLPSYSQNDSLNPKLWVFKTIKPTRLDYIGYGLNFIAGSLNGCREAAKSDYSRIPDSWNPDNTWRAKYKNGDPNQGEKFLGSTTIFIGLTDKYHAFGSIQTISQLTYLGTVSYKFNNRSYRGKQLWLKLGTELTTSFITFNLGKTLTMMYLNSK